MTNQKYFHRYTAQLCVEAETPLKVGNGEEGLLIDSLVARDAAGLPYIPGTSLTGVLRHSLADAEGFEPEIINSIFGSSDKANITGSRLIISSAHIVDYTLGEVCDGGTAPTAAFLSAMKELPTRDHVAINDRGVAKDTGKFEDEVLYAGSRFVFSLELQGREDDRDNWERILDMINTPLFRIGGGTRKGFGKLKLISIEEKVFNLENEAERKAYLDTDSRLRMPKGAAGKMPVATAQLIHYRLDIQPRDFFFFGGSEFDNDVDARYKTERKIIWNGNKGELQKEGYILIPATSVKGALSHRTAYHYNKMNGSFIDLNRKPEELNNAMQARISELETMTLKELEEIQRNKEAEYESIAQTAKKQWSINKAEAPNNAVRNIFGYAINNKKEGAAQEGRRGRLIMDDCFIAASSVQEKIFDHLKVDPYTGGALDSALYQEKTVMLKKDQPFICLDIYLQHDDSEESEACEKAFENALRDVCLGMLPLGGLTSKGHGFFSGKLFKNNHDITKNN